MKKTGMLLAGILCLAMLAGCGTQEGAEDSSQGSSASSSAAASSVSSVSASSGEKKETESTSASSSASKTEEVPEGNYPYIEGDFTYEECIELPEYKGIELKAIHEEIDDQYVEDYIHAMMLPETLEDPKAEAQDRDTVIIDFVGTIDGLAFEGGTAEGADLVLGSDSYIDGFEDGIIGMKVGDEKDLELQFPDDYWDADMAGLPATFHVTLKEIRRYPEITDEVVEELTSGEYTDATAYRAHIREIAMESKANEIRETQKENAWNYVYDRTEFKKLPLKYVQEAMDRYATMVQQEADYYGAADIEEYVEAAGMTMEDYENQRLIYGEEIAKARLISEAIWEKEGCSKDDEAWQNYRESLASSYGYSVEDFEELYGKDNIDQYCVNMVTLDILVDNAVIKE